MCFFFIDNYHDKFSFSDSKGQDREGEPNCKQTEIKVFFAFIIDAGIYLGIFLSSPQAVGLMSTFFCLQP